MNPDINDLRRDLGYIPSSGTGAPEETGAQPAADPAPARNPDSGSSTWGAILVLGAIVAWLLA